MGRVRFFGGRSQGAIRLALNPADTETVTIGPPASGSEKVYEFDNNATVTPGNITVTIGASAALSAIALRDAINANAPVPPVVAFIDPKDTLVVRLAGSFRGASGNHPLAETMAGGGNEVSGAAMTGGENGGSQIVHRGEYVVTAMDVAADQIVIETGVPVTARFVEIEIRDATGLVKAHTALVTVINNNRISLNFAGLVDPAATDVITWQAWE